MNTLEVHGSHTHIFWPTTPQAVRDQKYPGVKMLSVTIKPPHSLQPGVTFCKAWQLDGLSHVSLIELP